MLKTHFIAKPSLDDLLQTESEVRTLTQKYIYNK